MKKLFFTALVAVAAISGVKSAVDDYYLFGESQKIPCTNIPSPTCALQFGLPSSTLVYDKPVPELQTPIGILSDYSLIFE